MKILVSGGGTAGHISPILATVAALKELDKDADILYVGQKGGMEAKIAQSAGLKFAAINAGKYRRFHGTSLVGKLTDLENMALNARDITRLVAGYAESLRLIRHFKPDVIFVKGGYVGLPVGLAAGTLRVPYVIHESDLIPGLTNRILSKRAAAIATGFPANKYRTLPGQKLVYTGNPVRPELLSKHRLEGMMHFKLQPEVPVVLIMGGSQGAMAINDCILDALPQLVQRYQLIHLTGERDIERIRFAVRRMSLSNPERYHPYSFLNDEMGLALAASDVVVARAGANTIAELAALGKPTILIPNHRLTGGHQTANAMALARAGAARVIQEDRLSPSVLGRELERITSSESEQAFLSEAITAFAVPDSPRRLAELILKEGSDA